MGACSDRWPSTVAPSVLVLCALLTFLVSSFATAGDVYTWTDEDGEVHFSDSPPPDSEADRVQGQSQSNGAAGGAAEPTGEWYARRGASRVKLSIEDDGSFSQLIRTNTEDTYSEHRRRGTWRHEGPKLHLKVLDDYAEGQSEAKRVQYHVIDLTRTRMRVRTPDERIDLYLRFDSREKLRREERKLVGQWQQKSGHYEFKLEEDGTLEAREISSYSRQYRIKGNWYRKNDSLTLEFITGMPEVAPLDGPVHRFKVAEESGARLKLDTEGGDPGMTLLRQTNEVTD